jgi:hypothetical protein
MFQDINSLLNYLRIRTDVFVRKDIKRRKKKNIKKERALSFRPESKISLINFPFIIFVISLNSLD